MKKTKYTVIITLIAILIGSIVSCSNDKTCRKSNKVETGMSFYLDTINLTNGRWTEQKISLGTLSVQGIGTDSLLYNNSIDINSIKAPLNPFAETSQFQFIMGDITDTITINYKNKVEVLSLECGSIRTHTIESAQTTGHFIDSITILTPNVNTTHVENLKLHHIK